MPKKDRPVRLSEDDLVYLYVGFSENRDKPNWENPEKKPEAFELPIPGPPGPPPAISDDTREELETKAWRGDLKALATLIRQDPRYIGCPWTLAVADLLRRNAAWAETQERRAEWRDRLTELAGAWIAVDHRGHRLLPPPWRVALIGDGLMKAYTEAMTHPPLIFSEDCIGAEAMAAWMEQVRKDREKASRPVRLPEARTRAAETFRRFVGPARLRHPDQQWLDWFEDDLKHLLKGDGRRALETVVIDRLAIVFDLKHKKGWELGRVKTLWELGQPWWRAKKGKSK
jgi:hypothetical protein